MTEEVKLDTNLSISKHTPEYNGNCYEFDIKYKGTIVYKFSVNNFDEDSYISSDLEIHKIQETENMYKFVIYHRGCVSPKDYNRHSNQYINTEFSLDVSEKTKDELVQFFKDNGYQNDRDENFMDFVKTKK